MRLSSQPRLIKIFFLRLWTYKNNDNVVLPDGEINLEDNRNFLIFLTKLGRQRHFRPSVVKFNTIFMIIHYLRDTTITESIL